MDDYQRLWMTCFTPVLFLYAIAEINRGWNILRHQEYSLNFAFSTQAWLVKLFQGEEKSVKYKEKLLNNTAEMKLSGYYSLIGGILLIVVCLYWVYLLMK